MRRFRLATELFLDELSSRPGPRRPPYDELEAEDELPSGWSRRPRSYIGVGGPPECGEANCRQTEIKEIVSKESERDKKHDQRLTPTLSNVLFPHSSTAPVMCPRGSIRFMTGLEIVLTELSKTSAPY